MDTLPTIGSLLAKNLSERPDAVALVDGERRVSYAELDRLCASAAGWLQAQGIGAGDRVAVWLVNRIEWLTLLFALGRLGATMMSVNTRFRAAELDHVLARSSARLLIIQRHFRSIDFDAVLAEVNGSGLPALQRIAVLDGGSSLPPTILGRPTVAFAPHAAGIVQTSADRSAPDALAILFTTSGTTQGPKLVMHVQGAIALHAQRVAEAFGFEAPGSATLGAVPFCGTFGLVAALASLAAGAPLIMMEAFDARRAAALVREHRLTHVFGTDEMLRRLLELDAASAALPSVRLFGCVLNEELAARADARGWPVAGIYGSSEVQALFSLQSMDLPMAERILPGGWPASAEAEVRVRDIDSGQLLPPGASGELEIRAPTSFIGYLDNPEATAKVRRSDGFFRTGDVGRVREDGSFVFETRSGDAIRLGGFLVSPIEIEAVIRQLPGVAEAQVVAVEIGKQTRAVAFVIRQAGDSAVVSEAAVVDWVKSRMAGYKVPAQVWFIDEYPVTHSANGDKIQRAKLREMALSLLAGQS